MIADIRRLRRLSGLKRPADVKRWLRTNGVPFMVQPSGHPVTTLDAINRALYGGRKGTEPDFSKPCYRQKSTRRMGATTTLTGTTGTSSAA